IFTPILSSQEYCDRERGGFLGLVYQNPIKSTNISQPIYDDSGNVTSVSKSYSVNYCLKNRKPYYDRISRLKMALITMFANPKSNEVGFGEEVDLNKYKIGLGSFLGSGGRIDSNIAALRLEHRKALIDKVIALEPI